MYPSLTSGHKDFKLYNFGNLLSLRKEIMKSYITSKMRKNLEIFMSLNTLCGRFLWSMKAKCVCFERQRNWRVALEWSILLNFWKKNLRWRKKRKNSNCAENLRERFRQWTDSALYFKFAGYYFTVNNLWLSSRLMCCCYILKNQSVIKNIIYMKGYSILLLKQK